MVKYGSPDQTLQTAKEGEGGVNMNVANFLGVFLGAIVSFLLWFGGEKFIQFQRDRKARNNIVREIQEEIKFNIVLLYALAESIPKAFNSNTVPLYIPGRLRLSVYDYMISSGEIRLLDDFSKQRLIRLAAFTSDSFNKFVENTELILAICNLKPHVEALALAKHRLTGLVELAQADRKELQDTLSQLQSGRLSKEEVKSKGSNVPS